MARILGVVGNARKDGYTVQVLQEALAGAHTLAGVETELVHLLDYHFGPCRSCYECIRMAEHRCVLQDDLGERGQGRLWRKMEVANGLILATPVHFWSADALIHLFIERLYPFIWTGELRGMPVLTLSVASNQGFQLVANAMLCEWAFTLGMHYVGGLPVHAAYLAEALREARYLGTRLGEAALKDEQQGRKAPSDEELWLEYVDKPWSVLSNYIGNLTRGTGDPALSIIRQALAQGTFVNPEAAVLLEQADKEWARFAQHHSLGERREAIRALVKASALWTHATWKEFLEEQLIKAPPPKAYRPLNEGKS
jgi:multimeric flavodoxin WrbA